MSSPPTLPPGALATFWPNTNYQGNPQTWTVSDLQNGQIIITSCGGYCNKATVTVPVLGTRSGCLPFLDFKSLSLAPGVVLKAFVNVNCSAPTNIAGWTSPSMTLVAGNTQLNVPDINETYQFNYQNGYVIIPPPSYQLTGTQVDVQVSYPIPGNQFLYNGECVGLDWQTNVGCASLDYNICPQFGGSGPLLGFGYANNYNNPQNRALSSVTVNCKYDLAQFQTYQDIENFYNYNWVDKSAAKGVYDSTIMPSICSRQTSVCPNDTAVGGGPMPRCSTFVMQGQNTLGTACQTWINRGRDPTSGINPANADTTMGSYCSSGAANKEDCRCLQSAVVQPPDPGYIAGVKAFAGYNVSTNCWYIPCQAQSKDNYLITSGIASQTCPQNICIQSTTYDSITSQYGASISLGPINNAQSCPSTTTNVTPPPAPPAPAPAPAPGFGQPPITPSPGQPPITPAPTSPPISPATRRPNYLIYIIIGVVVILLIAGVIGLFFIIK